MQWYQRFYLQDLIKAWHPSIPVIKKKLKLSAEADIRWGYSRTESVCPKLLGGNLSLSQALAAVGDLKLPVALKNNSSAIDALHPFFSRIEANHYPLDRGRYRFGMTPREEGLSCQIKMLGLLHDGQNKKLYWNNYRLRWPTDEWTRQIIASVASMAYLDHPDYAGASLHLVDVSSLGGESRTLRHYDARQINLLGETELSEFFEPIVKALIELIEEGYEPVKKERVEISPIPDVNQPGLFD